MPESPVVQAEREARPIYIPIDRLGEAVGLLARAGIHAAASPGGEEREAREEPFPKRGERWQHHSTGVYEIVSVHRDGLYATAEDGGSTHFLRIDYFRDRKSTRLNS